MIIGHASPATAMILDLPQASYCDAWPYDYVREETLAANRPWGLWRLRIGQVAGSGAEGDDHRPLHGDVAYDR